ncbi:MAG TPA: carbamoyltransferase HypF [Chthonomonadales bacterium]|nr:carbamoyltransferase HypF [Chthonomonadales bacterium]
MSGPRGRLRVVVRGAVQGVGFRPFVHRLATGEGLAGWVRNTAQGVAIEVEGLQPSLDRFVARLEAERPPASVLLSVEVVHLPLTGYLGFEIRPSDVGGTTAALVLPDLATCDDCLRELWDPQDRRHRYPFTNCTHCGPRMTIVERLPYDRPSTTMRGFTMCPACQTEYDAPSDRRFHAQPNACPHCGPHVELWAPDGARLSTHDEAIAEAVRALRSGAIVAMKGIGGFLLMTDARSEGAVSALRERKRREEKPLALMVPDLDAAEGLCFIDPVAARKLASSATPIVLLPRRPGAAVAASVAPRQPALGVMLPCSPLHHLVMREVGFPVVATSGNLSDEPICTDEQEALTRLRGLADLFLVHNRPIARHCDDSVVRVLMGRPLMLRRARGYAPLPITLGTDLPPVLGVGAHLKSAVAFSIGRDVFVSQHIGDLETAEASRAFDQVVSDFRSLYALDAVRVACDLHPDYVSTRRARAAGIPVNAVQHHHAHVASCMAENDLDGELLGVAWDGAGYGPDGTVWGGEFLVASRSAYRRFAHLRTFPLPGGERAVREPRRSALGALWELGGAARAADAMRGAPDPFTGAEIRLLLSMLERRVNCPRTSSAGRLFDVVAALVGLRGVTRHEGQAAMELEAAVRSAGDPSVWPPRRPMGHNGAGSYPVAVLSCGSGPLVLDWAPMLEGVLRDVEAGEAASLAATRFHSALAEAIVEVARRAGLHRVALTGGCFQNVVLTAWTVEALRAAGFEPFWHQRVPPNDGGIALGQVVAAGSGPREGG